MPQITGPLTISDGSATPVAKSFYPQRVAPEVSVFTERTASASAGFIVLDVRFSAASGKRKTNRTDIALTLPITEVVDGIATVTKTGLFRGYFVEPDTFTAADRANLQAYAVNSLAHPSIKAIVKDLDPLY